MLKQPNLMFDDTFSVSTVHGSAIFYKVHKRAVFINKCLVFAVRNKKRVGGTCRAGDPGGPESRRAAVSGPQFQDRSSKTLVVSDSATSE